MNYVVLLVVLKNEVLQVAMVIAEFFLVRQLFFSQLFNSKFVNSRVFLVRQLFFSQLSKS